MMDRPAYNLRFPNALLLCFFFFLICFSTLPMVKVERCTSASSALTRIFSRFATEY